MKNLDLFKTQIFYAYRNYYTYNETIRIVDKLYNQIEDSNVQYEYIEQDLTLNDYDLYFLRFINLYYRTFETNKSIGINEWLFKPLEQKSNLICIVPFLLNTTFILSENKTNQIVKKIFYQDVCNLSIGLYYMNGDYQKELNDCFLKKLFNVCSTLERNCPTQVELEYYKDCITYSKDIFSDFNIFKKFVTSKLDLDQRLKQRELEKKLSYEFKESKNILLF